MSRHFLSLTLQLNSGKSHLEHLSKKDSKNRSCKIMTHKTNFQWVIETEPTLTQLKVERLTFLLKCSILSRVFYVNPQRNKIKSRLKCLLKVTDLSSKRVTVIEDNGGCYVIMMSIQVSKYEQWENKAHIAQVRVECWTFDILPIMMMKKSENACIPYYG